MVYRKDIDALRAISVIAVIFFHLGFLKNGYLGVDVFFVISGYLITSIIKGEINKGQFSFWKFYERRIRRILPALSFTVVAALIFGYYLMLPDDLENLAQSVIASNLSINNVLMLITSADYWAVKNDYKPLMHTWSLGIEEQFYLIYPLIIFYLSKWKDTILLLFLVIISVLSVSLFLFYGSTAARFYLLPYRFFELALGGIFAITNVAYPISYSNRFKWFFLAALSYMLVSGFGENRIDVILTVLFSLGYLAAFNKEGQSHIQFSVFFENKILLFLGKISFSLYLWHQIVFAFARYSFVEEITPMNQIPIQVLTFSLSVLSYYLIENPFRNKKVLSNTFVFSVLIICILGSSLFAGYLYAIGGIHKDFKSLSLKKQEFSFQKLNLLSSKDNIHIHYNEKVRELDKPFSTSNSKKILVIGNSFGRDIVNVLLETELKDSIEISYLDDQTEMNSEIEQRIINAYAIFYCAKDFVSKNEFKRRYVLDNSAWNKLICVGTKDFGNSNGIHFARYQSIQNFSKYYISPKKGISQLERKLKKEWGAKYLSLLDLISDSKGNVRAFTAQGKFISQDTVHFTQDGARYFANMLFKKLQSLILEAH